jgi:GNAT superfamily N-acetyltransferase
MAALDVRSLTAQDAAAERDALSEVLMSCVHNGASVNFMLPFPKAEADAFWDRVIPGVAAGNIRLVAAYIDGRLVGTGQLAFAPQPNQPHRADIAKMLVHHDFRKRGVGEAVMAALEREARAAGKTLLTLDTASDAAERLYQRSGFVRFGIVPGYALWPQGGLGDAVFYYKQLV